MRITDLIQKKIDNLKYTQEELDFICQGIAQKTIPDYQISAWAMAVRLLGLSNDEIVSLTLAMAKTGRILDLSSIKGVKVDKHSTGGVGDKVTLVLAPVVASLGAVVAKMSGRGLGFTGGTLDKLESIEGYQINLSIEQFYDVLNKHQIAVIGQTKDIDPADKYLYDLRDVTATVDSLPLICSSIMSKKYATGADVILLDVKWGNGALMQTKEDADKLANTLESTGNKLNRRAIAISSDMNRPLGRAIGNRLEVLEAIETLHNRGTKDFVDEIELAASTLLFEAKLFSSKQEALKAIREVLANGKAYQKFLEWIAAQGGNIKVFDDPNWFNPKVKHEVRAKSEGTMKITSALNLAKASTFLGAGRMKKEDAIDYNAGIYVNKKTNEKVKANDVIFTLYSSKAISDEILNYVENAYQIIKG